jgi:hypothetical protein
MHANKEMPLRDKRFCGTRSMHSNLIMAAFTPSDRPMSRHQKLQKLPKDITKVLQCIASLLARFCELVRGR